MVLIACQNERNPSAAVRGLMAHFRSGRLIAKRSIYLLKELFAIGVDVGQTLFVLHGVCPEPAQLAAAGIPLPRKDRLFTLLKRRKGDDILGVHMVT